MNLVAYTRVSTDRQAEDGLGLDVQREGILSWAAANGHRIVAAHTDEGVSGSNGLDTREGLADAINALKTPEADGLVVYKLDRLARDFAIQEMIFKDIWKLGKHMFSVDPDESGQCVPDSPDFPSRTLIRQILGAVAQYDRSLIALRLRNGRQMKRRNGGYAFGAPPYGYKTVNGELIPIPEELATIERMRDLRKQGLTLRAIAAELEKAQIQPRRGKHWSPEAIRGILNRARPVS